MLLKDRVAIVYGGSGAVGGAVAKAFAREGAHVFIAARRVAPLEAVAAEIRAAGGKVEIAPVDTSDKAAVEAHLAAIADRAGPVKLMFNGVEWGDTQGHHVIDMDLERFIRPIRQGLINWFHTGTAVARHMAANGGGAIVGITANAGRQALPYTGGFGVACAAVEHFLRMLAVENGPEGVRVTWVRSPGSPDAPGVREAWQLRADEWGMTFDEVHAQFAKDTPLRYITPLPQIANAVVMLASDYAAGMTATMANATGGAQVD
ncbi:MAG: SDR family oxidoreductase [Hyphomicrobiales bacterium]|nr:MAG: SDR family oxidoreductase [Hyphomicrobiales bacterium]